MTHKDIEVWQKAIAFVMDLYHKTSSFPKEELYGLVSQLRRSTVSIPSNIAEGAALQSNKEYIQFLYVALGSLMDLDTQLIIAKNLNFLSNESLNDLQSKTNEIGKMLNGFIQYRKYKL